MFIRDYSGSFSLRALFRSPVFILLLLFLMGVLLKSFDDRFANTIFTWIPNWITPFIICFLLIRDDRDLQFLAKIISWQTAIIGFFIIVEYFTKYYIGLTILHTNPDPVFSYYPYERSGYYRPVGLYISAALTGFYYAFAFPIVFWHAIRTRMTGVIICIISLACIVMLQTRATYIAVFLSLIIIFIKRDRVAVKKLLAILAIGLIFIMSHGDLSKWTENIYKKTVVATFTETDLRSDVQIITKLERIPRALTLFLEKPLVGYLSPDNTSQFVMDDEDLPSPLLYLLTGGIFLFLIYMAMILALPITTFALSRDRMLPYKDRMFLYYAGVAFLSGILVLFTSTCEEHFPIMFMLYASIYKVYVYNRHQSRSSSAPAHLSPAKVPVGGFA